MFPMSNSEFYSFKAQQQLSSNSKIKDRNNDEILKTNDQNVTSKNPQNLKQTRKNSLEDGEILSDESESLSKISDSVSIPSESSAEKTITNSSNSGEKSVTPTQNVNPNVSEPLSEKISELEKQIDRLSKQLKEQREENATLTTKQYNENSEHQKKIDSFTETINNYQKTIKECDILKINYQKTIEECDTLKGKNVKLQEKWDKIESRKTVEKIKGLKTKLEEKEKENKNKNDQILKYQENLKNLNTKIELEKSNNTNKNFENDLLKIDLKEKNDELEKLKQRNQHLSSEIEKLQNFKQQTVRCQADINNLITKQNVLIKQCKELSNIQQKFQHFGKTLENVKKISEEIESKTQSCPKENIIAELKRENEQLLCSNQRLESIIKLKKNESKQNTKVVKNSRKRQKQYDSESAPPSKTTVLNIRELEESSLTKADYQNSRQSIAPEDPISVGKNQTNNNEFIRIHKNNSQIKELSHCHMDSENQDILISWVEFDEKLNENENQHFDRNKINQQKISTSKKDRRRQKRKAAEEWIQYCDSLLCPTIDLPSEYNEFAAFATKHNFNLATKKILEATFEHLLPILKSSERLIADYNDILFLVRNDETKVVVHCFGESNQNLIDDICLIAANVARGGKQEIDVEYFQYNKKLTLLQKLLFIALLFMSNNALGVEKLPNDEEIDFKNMTLETIQKMTRDMSVNAVKPKKKIISFFCCCNRSPIMETVQCEICEEWYFLSCIGLMEDPEKPFTCVKCRKPVIFPKGGNTEFKNECSIDAFLSILVSYSAFDSIFILRFKQSSSNTKFEEDLLSFLISEKKTENQMMICKKKFLETIYSTHDLFNGVEENVLQHFMAKQYAVKGSGNCSKCGIREINRDVLLLTEKTADQIEDVINLRCTKFHQCHCGNQYTNVNIGFDNDAPWILPLNCQQLIPWQEVEKIPFKVHNDKLHLDYHLGGLIFCANDHFFAITCCIGGFYFTDGHSSYPCTFREAINRAAEKKADLTYIIYLI